MGKTRHNKRKNKIAGPTGLPSVKDIEKELDGESNSACPSDAALQNIVEQLQGQVEDKVFALHSLASIFHTAGCVQNVVQQKVARIAGPLLVDPSSTVRNAAAGALRNLTSTGNHEICDMLIEQDIMTPVSAFLYECSDHAYDLSSSSEKSDTFAQVVYLLWNLCEGSNMAVQNFNDRNLLPVLLKYVSADPKHLNVTLAIVHCLITIVEDNCPACSLLQKSETTLYGLLAIKGDSSGLLLLRVLTSGVLLKIKMDKAGVIAPVLLDAIVAPLKINQRQKLNQLTSTDPSELTEDHVALEEINQLLEAQQVSLELLTNLCAEGGDDHMDLDSNSTSSDDGICDFSVSEPEPETDFIDLNESTTTLIPEVHELISSQQLIPHIWEKTRLPAENVCALLHEHSGGQHLLKRVDILRARAFSCLNNIIPALDIQDIGGPQNLFQMWSEIAALVFKNSEVDPEILEAASSAMRAAVEKFARSSHDKPIEIQFKEIEFMFSAAPISNPGVRANILKTVCMLGMMTLCQLSEQNLLILKSAGKFLLDACGHETELWVQAEALDSIMDLFSEDETDMIAGELTLTDHLQALLPSFRRKVHLNRKKLGDHYPLVSTVKTNLPRFIKYKSKRISELVRTVHIRHD